MPETQKSIYYVAADTREAAENSPFLEQLTKKGLEVLFLIDPIDEVAMTNLQQFKEKTLVDISKAGRGETVVVRTEHVFDPRGVRRLRGALVR